MKKRILLLLIIVILTSCAKKVKAPESKLKVVIEPKTSKRVQYEQLKEEADLIILAKVDEPLNSANSFLVMDEYFSKRTLIVEKVLKGHYDQQQLAYKEQAATDNDYLYRSKDYIPLENQERVILFLNEINQDIYEIRHGNDSVIHTDDLRTNKNTEIMINTIFEFLNPKILGKKIDYHPVHLIEEAHNEFKKVLIETDLFPIELEISPDYSIIKFDNYYLSH